MPILIKNQSLQINKPRKLFSVHQSTSLATSRFQSVF